MYCLGNSDETIMSASVYGILSQMANEQSSKMFRKGEEKEIVFKSPASKVLLGVGGMK